MTKPGSQGRLQQHQAQSPKSHSYSISSKTGLGYKKPRSEVRKCRKVYGMENREMWCTQCKWKKACSRFIDWIYLLKIFHIWKSTDDLCTAYSLYWCKVAVLHGHLRSEFWRGSSKQPRKKITVPYTMCKHRQFVLIVLYFSTMHDKECYNKYKSTCNKCIRSDWGSIRVIEDGK